MNDKDLKIFNNFLRLAMKRSGDEAKFLSIADDVGVTDERIVDLLNRLMLIFTDIPTKLFPDDEVRITLLEDYRKIIHEVTMEQELGEEYDESEVELGFDDVMDLFDFD